MMASKSQLLLLRQPQLLALAQSAHMLVIMLNAYPHGFAVCFVAPHDVSGALSFGQHLVWCERVRV